jgi:hypothetical protein
MSALPRIADIRQCRWDVRKVPQADLFFDALFFFECALRRRSPHYSRQEAATDPRPSDKKVCGTLCVLRVVRMVIERAALASLQMKLFHAAKAAT